jgi:hypothetical protein
MPSSMTSYLMSRPICSNQPVMSFPAFWLLADSLRA